MDRRLARTATLGVVAVLLAGCSGAAMGSGATGTAPESPVRTQSPAVATSTPAGSATCQPDPARDDGYTSFRCKVDAPSLVNNKLGDPASLSTIVVLPPGYEASTKRYPTVYVLAGYTQGAGDMDVALGHALGAASPKPEMIFVLVGGGNALAGSFYVNSPVTGNWEDAVANDLVAYVDGHYRTLADAKSRGISGLSMGGSGSLTVGMHRTDVFGAIYAISPGLFDPEGAEARLGMPTVVQYVLKTQGELSGAVDAAKLVEKANASTEDAEFEFAYGAAFAPDPSSPLLMRFPYRLEGGKAVRDPELWRVWEAGFGGLQSRIEQYGPKLKALRGFGIDYGTNDYYAWLPKGCAYFAKLLGDAGIPVVVNVHSGSHYDRLAERMGQFMVPFMAEKLASS